MGELSWYIRSKIIDDCMQSMVAVLVVQHPRPHLQSASEDSLDLRIYLAGILWWWV